MAHMRVIQGTAVRPRQSAVEAAYDHFRVDRQGNLVSGSTLDHYRYLVEPFFEWLRDERPDVERFEDLGVNVVPTPGCCPPRWRASARWRCSSSWAGGRWAVFASGASASSSSAWPRAWPPRARMPSSVTSWMEHGDAGRLVEGQGCRHFSEGSVSRP